MYYSNLLLIDLMYSHIIETTTKGTNQMSFFKSYMTANRLIVVVRALHALKAQTKASNDHTMINEMIKDFENML